jgi:MFS family permease
VVRRWWQGFLEAARIRAVLAATWANAGFAAAFAALQAFYPIFLVHRGLSASLVGAFFGYYSFVSVLARLPSGVLVDRMEARRVATIGFSLATLGFFLLWRWPLPWPAFFAGTLIGLGAGTYLPANIVVVTRAAPAALRGSAFSLFTASWDLGGLLGPPLAGLLVARAGEAAVFGLDAGIALLTTLVYLALLLGRRPG